MTFFAVSHRGKAIFTAYFYGHNVSLYNARGKLTKSLSMDKALETYRFEGYLSSGLKYPVDDVEPNQVIV